MPLSILAGFLTMLAPCVLPLLPIILSGAGSSSSWRRPLVIIGSVCASIFLFTLVLNSLFKAVGISEQVLVVISGVILLGYGAITVFPQLWEWVEIKLGLNAKAAGLLAKAGKAANAAASNHKEPISSSNPPVAGNPAIKPVKVFWSEVLVGISLGPVFSSCSPTYAIIVAAILPTDFFTGFINLALYTVSFGLALFLVAIFGQKLIKASRCATDPYSIFRRSLGLLFIFIALLIITGLDKQITAWVLETGFLDVTRIENSLLGDKEIVL